MFVIKNEDSYIKFNQRGKTENVSKKDATTFNSKRGAGWALTGLKNCNYKELSIEEI